MCNNETPFWFQVIERVSLDLKSGFNKTPKSQILNPNLPQTRVHLAFALVSDVGSTHGGVTSLWELAGVVGGGVVIYVLVYADVVFA